MRAVLNETVEPPSRSNPTIPYALDKVALKALSPRRDQRFATALEFARALEAAASGALWHPEQLGALVADLHAERLRQTHALVQQAQGSTGEHSGLHVAGEPERGITLETPLAGGLVVSPAPLQAAGEAAEETTTPHFSDGPLSSGPTRSMRPRASDAGLLAMELTREPARSSEGAVTASRPDVDLHRAGSRPSGIKPPVAELATDSPSQVTQPPAGLRTSVDLRPKAAPGNFFVIGAALGVAVVASVGLWLWLSSPPLAVTPTQNEVKAAPAAVVPPPVPPAVLVAAPQPVPAPAPMVEVARPAPVAPVVTDAPRRPKAKALKPPPKKPLKKRK